MTPGTLMLASGAILAVSLVILVANFISLAKGNLDGNGVAVHVISGLIASGSGLALVAGFVWFLVATYAG